MSLNPSSPESFYDRVRRLKRYTSKQEKEALLLEDYEPLEKLFRILQPDTDIVPINDLEIVAFIYKLREISVNDIVEFIRVCDDKECGFQNLYGIEIKEFFGEESEIEDIEINGKVIPKGIYTSLDEVIDTDEMTLKDIKKYEDMLLKRTDKIFNPFIKKPCRKCGKELEISLDPRSMISKTNVSGIYQEYTQISFYTSNSKLDIDDMYPFERELTIGLVNKILEKQSEEPGKI